MGKRFKLENYPYNGDDLQWRVWTNDKTLLAVFRGRRHAMLFINAVNQKT